MHRELEAMSLGGKEASLSPGVGGGGGQEHHEHDHEQQPRIPGLGLPFGLDGGSGKVGLGIRIDDDRNLSLIDVSFSSF